MFKSKSTNSFPIGTSEHSVKRITVKGSKKSGSRVLAMESRGLDTPIRQISNLEIRSKQKQPKLFSSKSLSRLVTRSLFFTKKDNSDPNNAEESTVPQQDSNQNNQVIRGRRSRNNPFEDSNYELERIYENYKDRINSDSMIGLQSTSSLLNSDQNVQQMRVNCTLEQPNLSPIFGSQPSAKERDTTTNSGRGSSGGIPMSSTRVIIEAPNDGVDNSNSSSGSNKADKRKSNKVSKEKKVSKTKPFKSTKLVLRDVRNSISLRMKAKQDNQGFSKLSSDLQTPPTKLYSPFNIYENSVTKSTNQGSVTRARSKRKMILNGNESRISLEPETDISFLDSPKDRIALRHKKHLTQATKFAFDSPTGRLRESVKDVEHLQQCIEEISHAIRAKEITNNKCDI